MENSSRCATRAAQLAAALGMMPIQSVLDQGCVAGRELQAQGYMLLQGVAEPSRLGQCRLDGCHLVVSPWSAGEPLPFPDATFGGVVCVGHATGALYDEWCRILSPGGFVIACIACSTWDSDAGEVVTRAKQLEAEGRWGTLLVSTPEDGDPDQDGNPTRVKYAIWRLAVGEGDVAPPAACKQQ